VTGVTNGREDEEVRHDRMPIKTVREFTMSQIDVPFLNECGCQALDRGDFETAVRCFELSPARTSPTTCSPA